MVTWTVSIWTIVGASVVVKVTVLRKHRIMLYEEPWHKNIGVWQCFPWWYIDQKKPNTCSNVSDSFWCTGKGCWQLLTHHTGVCVRTLEMLVAPMIETVCLDTPILCWDRNSELLMFLLGNLPRHLSGGWNDSFLNLLHSSWETCLAACLEAALSPAFTSGTPAWQPAWQPA